jgi:hypothetical protein
MDGCGELTVDEVESHGKGASKGTQPQRIDLTVDEVLHGVPAKSPTEAGDVDHDDCACSR